MSSDIAISVQGLGKRYVRGGRLDGHDSFRDVLRTSVQGMFRKNGGNSRQQIFWALQNATFDVRRGENVGIIGLNGAGKSTLLKILSRITTPTTGSAQLFGRMGALLEVGTGFHQELTGRENTYLYGSILGMSQSEVARKFDAIVDFAEIGDFIDTPVKRYSSGMYVRLAFSVAAHLDPDILLLDEVLAVGDFTFQRKCMDVARQLERKGATILFVSHNMFSIKSMCPRVIYLRKGQVIFDGATDKGLRLYEGDSRLAPAPWFHPDPGLPEIEVTEITLMDEAGDEKTVFDHGERMRVRLRYNARDRILDPDIRLGMNRSDEVHCCSYSTAADGQNISELSGEGEIEMRTPPLRLVADQYTLTIAVREHRSQRTLLSLLGTTFHVRHPIFTANPYGVFNERGEWRISPAGNGALMADVKPAR